MSLCMIRKIKIHQRDRHENQMQGKKTGPRLRGLFFCVTKKIALGYFTLSLLTVTKYSPLSVTAEVESAERTIIFIRPKLNY